MSEHSSRQRATRTPKSPAARSDTKPNYYFSDILELDETCRPKDILDALCDLQFRNGSKMLSIDAQMRDYLVSAVSALSGHKRR
jgi:hypothetical protein